MDKRLEQIIKTEKRLNAIYNSILVFMFFFILFYLIQQFVCDAEPASAAEDLTALRFAQCVIAECDQCSVNPKEKDAIAWVLKKQARRTGRTLLEQTMAYCALYKGQTDRARAIYASTFDEPKHGSGKRWAMVWDETERWAKSFVAKPPPDPEPEADQWGGDTDIDKVLRRGWRIVAGPPEHANIFLDDGLKYDDE